MKEALVKLKPSLPTDINQKFGVYIVNYQKSESSIQLEGPISLIEKAHSDIKNLVGRLLSKEVFFETEYQVHHLKKAMEQIKAPIHIGCPESSQRKRVVLFSFDSISLQNSAHQITQLLSIISSPLGCKPEKTKYLELYKKDFLSKLPAKVTFCEDSVILTGIYSEIQESKKEIDTQVFCGLYSGKFCYHGKPFSELIEETVLKPFKSRESTFQYDISVPPVQDKSSKQVITIHVFCRNRDIWEQICQSLEDLNPSSQFYHLPHMDAEKLINNVKEQLENKYQVRIMKNRASSITISGLSKKTTQQCYDEIEQLIESKLIIEKYIPVDSQAYKLLELYQIELAELRRECSELTVLPPDKDAKSSIRIKGLSSQIRHAIEELSNSFILLDKNLSVIEFDLSCPSILFEMWSRRWNRMKQQVKRSKIYFTFSKLTQAGSDDHKISIKFEILGSEKNKLEEFSTAIQSESVQTEERVITLSPNGTKCLLKEKAVNTMNYLYTVINFSIGKIDEDSNKVTIYVPKKDSKNLSEAEKLIRNLVDGLVDINDYIDFDDPVIGFILLSPVESKPCIESAIAIAKLRQVSVQVVEEPHVRLRINGSESGIAHVKPLIKSAVIEVIEKSIGQIQFAIDPLYTPLLSASSFSRYQSKLERDCCVVCSYPKPESLPKQISISETPQGSISSDFQWRYEDDSHELVPYSPEDSRAIESMYQAKSPRCLVINKKQYTFNFTDMYQINTSTRFKRRIDRIRVTTSEYPLGTQGHVPSVHWRYENDSKVFVAYTPEDSRDIERMYQAKSPRLLIINTNVYRIDFTQMHQINTFTGFKRKINRLETVPLPKMKQKEKDEENEREKQSNDIIPFTLRGLEKNLPTAKEKLYAALEKRLESKVFQSLPKNITPALRKKLQEIASQNFVVSSFEKRSDGNEVLKLKGVKFKVSAVIHEIHEEIITSSGFEDVLDFAFPPEWEQQVDNCEIFPVGKETPEWKDIEKIFDIPFHKICSITRIQNKWLWEKYAIQKKRLDRKNGGCVNEKELFHGTRKNDPKLIYNGEDGFDMRYGAKGTWGVANYFAVKAEYSHGYAYSASSDGAKEMFLVKVLTGDSYESKPDCTLRMPPAKPTTKAQGGDVQFAQMKYDTVKGHTRGSDVYMTYDNDKAYPAYLIKYYNAS